MLPIVGVWGMGVKADRLIRDFKQKGYLVVHENQPACYKQVSILFIWIDLPLLESGQTDVTELWRVIKAMSDHLPERSLLVIKSPVPIGTGDAVQEWLNLQNKNSEVVICSDWTEDYGRVILGGGPAASLKRLRRMLSKECLPILVTSRKEAEFIIYATQAYFATKQSFVNQLLPFCDYYGMNPQTVARAIGLDPRIGQAFLSAGVNTNDQWILKGITSLLYQGEEVKIPFPLLHSVKEINDRQYEGLVEKVKSHAGPLKDKLVAVWAGIADPIEGDVKHAPLLSVFDNLLLDKGRIHLYDPFGRINWAKRYDSRIVQTKTPYDAAQHADLLLILVYHPKLAAIDLHHLKKNLNTPLIIDGANLYPCEMMESYGFEYIPAYASKHSLVGRKVRT
jgi:UDPglucose 6-dehydrogenase